MTDTPILYSKSTCPWCVDALEFFEEKDLKLDIRDVAGSNGIMNELIERTGQSSVPSFIYKDFIVVDFDIKEFNESLRKYPEIRKELKL